MIRRLLLICVASFVVSLFASPDNDDFAHRELLPGTNGTFQVYQLDATREEFEPVHANAPLIGYASVWWTWTAPADGILAISGDQSDFSTSLYTAVYQGDFLPQLHLVTGDNVKKYESLFVTVQRGESYQIGLSIPSDRPVDSTSGQVTSMRYAFYPPPPNDSFAQRKVLIGDVITLDGYTVGATREPGEPLHGDIALNKTVWWEWTPPESGVLLIEGAPSFAGVLRPYTGSDLSGLAPLPMHPARDRFEVRAGQTVQMAVAPYADTLAGPITLTLVFSPMRAVLPGSEFPDDENGNVTLELLNIPSAVSRLDVFFPTRPTLSSPKVSALTLTNLSAGVYELNVSGVDEATGNQFVTPPLKLVVGAGADQFSAARNVQNRTELGGEFDHATTESGEPPLLAGTTSTVWWRWTASKSGAVRLENGTFPSVNREVFAGTALSDLQRVKFENDTAPSGSLCVFKVEQGRTYWIRLSATEAGSAWGSTHFQFLSTVPNDLFENAQLLGPSERIILSLGFADCEAGEPGSCPPDTGSRWYRFTPSTSGTAFFNLDAWFSIQDRTSLSVYAGEALTTLSQVFPPQLAGSVRLTENTPYFFRIQVPNGLSEALDPTFQFDFVPRPPNDNIANASLIPSIPHGLIQGSCDLGTAEPGQSQFVPSAESVWYRFTAPEDGALAVRVTSILPDSSLDPYPQQLAFATGSVDTSLIYDESQFHFGSVAAVNLRAGQQALLAVWKSRPPQALFTRSAFELEHFFVPRPANDDFGTRTELAGAVGVVTNFLWNASLETEADYKGLSANRSIWWKWFAPADGLLNLRTSGGDFSVFTGTDLVSLSAVDSFSFRSDADSFTRIQVPVVRSNWYNLRLSTRDFAQIGDPFDGFDRNKLDEATLEYRFSTVRLASPTNQAVFQVGAPITLEMAQPNPRFDGEIRFATFVRLTNWYLNPEPLSLALPAEPPFRATITNLFPSLHSFGVLVTNDLGEPVLSAPVLVRIAPGNDAFTNATVLIGGSLDVETTFSGSATERNEPAVLPGYGSVWYNWRPIASGPVRLRFLPPGAEVNVFTGTALTNLKSLATLETSFDASPSSNYFLRVSGPASGIGTLLSGVLEIRQTTITASPTNLASFAFGKPISIDVTTTESPERFHQLEVRLDEKELVTLSAPAFHYALSNVPSGPHELIFNGDFTTGEKAIRVTNTIFVADANDAFSNRIAVPFVSGTISGKTYGASSESGMPHAPADLWYQWTAPGDGLLFVGTAKVFPGISGIALYRGNQLTNLVSQPNRIDRPLPPSASGWQVQSNITYIVSLIEGGEPLPGADFDLVFGFQPTARNDAFADRIPLAGLEGQVDGNITLARLEADEPAYSQFTPAAASVWWTWTPPSDGVLEISYPTENQPQTQTVRPWQGDKLSALVALPLLQDGGPFGTGSGYYHVQAGVPLQISFAFPRDDYNVPWAWRLITPPPNDNFATRIILTGHEIFAKGTTVGAALEAAESHFVEAASTWWSWTSDVDADLWIAVTNAGSPLRVQIFTGAALGSLEQIAAGQSQSAFRIPVRTGTAYQIMVGTDRLPGADYELTLSVGNGVLPNDSFASAQPLDPHGWRPSGGQSPCNPGVW